jgi:membrane protease YdiL (CAAX protease family)
MGFMSGCWQRIPRGIRAVLTGFVILFCGALGWSAITFSCLQLAVSPPWVAGPLVLLTDSIFLWGFWRYLGGAWPPRSTAELRRRRLRADQLQGRVWAWTLTTGVFATLSFVCLVNVWGRLVPLQPWSAPGISHYSSLTAICILIGAAAEAGIVEEAAFRGYMQESLEEQFGPAAAIAITSVLFGLVHLANGHQEIAWLLPYTFFGAVLGILARTANSIMPGTLLHAAVDAVRFWLAWRGGPSSPHRLIWQSGLDAAFWLNLVVAVIFGAAGIMAQGRLAAVCLQSQRLGGRIAESP